MLKMAVLLSGSGRTLDNFHEGIQQGTLAGEIQVVISNVKDVLGLTKAEKYGYPAFHAADSEKTNAYWKNMILILSAWPVTSNYTFLLLDLSVR